MYIFNGLCCRVLINLKQSLHVPTNFNSERSVTFMNYIIKFSNVKTVQYCLRNIAILSALQIGIFFLNVFLETTGYRFRGFTCSTLKCVYYIEFNKMLSRDIQFYPGIIQSIEVSRCSSPLHIDTMWVFFIFLINYFFNRKTGSFVNVYSKSDEAI